MGYGHHAASLADTLRRELRATVTLMEGTKGCFDIRVDGRLVYSKFESKRIPDTQKILEILRTDSLSQLRFIDAPLFGK